MPHRKGQTTTGVLMARGHLYLLGAGGVSTGAKVGRRTAPTRRISRSATAIQPGCRGRRVCSPVRPETSRRGTETSRQVSNEEGVGHARGRLQGPPADGGRGRRGPEDRTARRR